MVGKSVRARAVRLQLALAMLACFGVVAMEKAEAGPALLFEPESGQVLYADEPDRLWHPASVTKLMTAYLVFDAVANRRLTWDDDVPLSEHARAQPATRIGLRGGIKLNVEQAVRGLILRSANDFATALAERVGGSEPAFVDAMNATAKRLGMDRTVFRNPHGLPDPDQVTTARDLARLAAAIYRDFPDRAEVFSTSTVRIHKGTFHSQNDLLRSLDGADGMKTGFTCASGYNVVASASRNGRRLVAIVLGAVNRQKRSERATELLDAGFAHIDGTATQPVAAERGATVTLTAANAHPKAASAGKPTEIIIQPVALASLPLSPAASELAANIGRQVRSGKCRGYSGFQRHEPEPAAGEGEADDETAKLERPVVTGSVSRASSPKAKSPVTTIETK